ncbi:MAG: hypothetical protein OYI31_05455 [Chloroflexota bacterium]|nr:hypothetical protein [Chloroflexota bacterium]MDE2942434.1 hypothetical protein [Chloroflexota bacterium]MDE3267886.1 hypothetical protein [Chloroflexota bacterium]
MAPPEYSYERYDYMVHSVTTLDELAGVIERESERGWRLAQAFFAEGRYVAICERKVE